jgi:hypothetical protein
MDFRDCGFLTVVSINNRISKASKLTRYLGGHAICPGRFLAKNAIILSAALIADRYDMELLEDLPKVSPAKFGLGSLKPGAAIPFRIRKRNLGTKE